MILDSIAALIEYDFLVGNNHDELIALRTIIYDTVIIFCFRQRKYFEMHMLSNQTVLNPGMVASVLVTLVTEFQWTGINRPRVLRTSFNISLFIITCTVEWLYRSIHHGLTNFSDPWV